MDLTDQALGYFDQHYNCAQSVLAPFAQQYGCDLEIALKIATPFGEGMGHAGQVCGAVSGGLMVIGLAHGITLYDKEKKEFCYRLAYIFQSRFRQLHGEVTCPGLLGLDIGNAGELAAAHELDLFNQRCRNFVRDAARIVGEILAEAQ